MEYLRDGVYEAVHILLSLDQETYIIIGRSLMVTVIASLIGSFIGVPLGLIMGIKEYPGKVILGRMLHTCMSLPPVVIGLFVAILLSRKGVFGQYQLLFTTKAMMIAQIVLVTPIMMSIVYNEGKKKGFTVIVEAKNLGARGVHIFIMLIKELKTAIYTAIITGFGRGISEVGAVMIVGGNIKGHTRVMTTYIAMNNSMGHYEKSLAMGIVLLSLSFMVNSLIYFFMEPKSKRRKSSGSTIKEPF